MQVQLVLVAMAAVVACCHGAALEKVRIPPIWRKLVQLPREQRVLAVQNLLTPATRSILDDQVVNFIYALLARPNSDPLEIPYIKLNITKDFATLHGNMDTVTVSGLSALTVDVMKINPLFLKMDFGITIPKFGMRGNYDFDGIFGGILPVYGKGPFELRLDGAKVGGSIQMGTNLAGNVFIKSLTVDLGIEGFFFDFKMLLGSEELSDVVNEMINDLGMGFFATFENSIESAVANYVVTWFNTTFAEYTLSEIIDLITGGGAAAVLSECKPYVN